jgi:hypothetical protein
MHRVGPAKSTRHGPQFLWAEAQRMRRTAEGYAALYPGAFVYGGNTGKKMADYKELMSEAGGPRLPGLRCCAFIYLLV